MKLVNPFYCFSLIFSVALILYQLRWSELLSDMSFELMTFLLISIIISSILGYFCSKIIVDTDSLSKKIEFNKKNHIIMSVCIFILNLLQGIYEGGFPLTNSQVVYTEFGIPTVHVLFFIGLYFYVIRTFEKYLHTNEKRFLFLSLINTYPFVLTINRAILVLLFVNMVFLFILIKKIHFKIKHFAVLIVVLLIASLSFGLMGNMRINQDYRRDYAITDSRLILTIGEATPEFKESIIPDSLFWVYLYTTSPLANLQANVDNDLEINREYDMSTFMKTQLLPDSISNRINLSPIQITPVRIRPELNVGSGFLMSYLLLGFKGIYIFMLFFFLYVSIVIFLVKKYCLDYFNFIISILCVMSIFLIFNNSLRYDVLVYQIVIVFFIALLKKFNKYYKEKLGEGFK